MSLKATASRRKHFLTHVEMCITNGMNHIDAICDYCEKNSIDPGTVGGMIPKVMKEKIEVEAKDLNFIPGKTRKLFE